MFNLNDSKNMIMMLLASLLIASAGTNAFQLSKKQTLQEETDAARLKADSILSVKLLIEKEYNRTILDLDNYRKKYTEVND